MPLAGFEPVIPASQRPLGSVNGHLSNISVCLCYSERKPLCLKDRALSEDLRDLDAKLSCWYRPSLPSVHEPFVNVNLRLL